MFHFSAYVFYLVAIYFWANFILIFSVLIGDKKEEEFSAASFLFARRANANNRLYNWVTLIYVRTFAHF